MDPEQTFLRVHARLSGVLSRLLTPRFRALLEYICLCNALMLLALLVVMHVNFVAQPGCSEEFSASEIADAQLVQIKITGSWNLIAEDYIVNEIRTESKGNVHDASVEEPPAHDEPDLSQTLLPDQQVLDVGGEGWNILAAKFWLNLLGNNARRGQVAKRTSKADRGTDTSTTPIVPEEASSKLASRESSSEESAGLDGSPRPLTGPGRGPLGTALLHYIARWSSYFGVLSERAEQSMLHFWQIWRVAGWEPFTASPKGDRRSVAWNKLDSVIVDLTEKRRKVLDPTYLYSVEKGYLMLSEGAKFHHNIKTVNVTISAQNACFGNKWQQLLIDNFVGYDTILMNSLLNAREKGYLYNFQTKELYNLNYLQEFSGVPHGFEDYIVFKCGVLITSLFVFFTTTMSVSFTLRETQARMLKFTVQLQHHARHRLPTYRLIFVHVIESLVFVPIMIGILFFLFEFFDDQLLAFMVLTLVWLCELYTMISVRTPLSMQYFPRFFFLYFMVFHIYFFSYTYGFSYLAFSATAAFMQHLVLYFWNRFEVPALHHFLRRRALLQQQGLHITSSAILTSAVQVARLSGAGDVRNFTFNPNNPRGGFEVRGPVNDAPLHTMPDRDITREGGGPRSPVDSYPTSGRTHVSSVDVNTGLSILVANAAARESGLERSFGLGTRIMDSDRQQHPRSDSEGVSGSSNRGRSSVANNESGEPESGVPVRTTSGPFSSLGNVLPWLLGHSSGNLVSFLPIFRDFQDNQEFGTSAVTTDQGEDGIIQRPTPIGVTNETIIRSRRRGTTTSQ
ncbi:hypothetical protein MPTK1_1g11860 [Marchantia polymorpha subsp. ruderalis]|uniref:Membralin n=2 Tax=Marchantia polymorpha TaxID=3197 RepID=A0AAF6AP58_MARPO|nr:hypothetical protein MARPO_0014s0041 [Marchantia polymorpha]BBM98228.1 hypothetical protein Mp_1g11860 [Marchantia polymorpha subsp. ruderalis]|eukprot:PTQ45492.1 hypothetical protein MARPO_0014s0041 [Marchantia polymorpha]